MKSLLTSSAIVLVMSLTASAAIAEGTGEVFSETSLRPLDITCADLTSAGETERSNLVFFIAGYKAAMEGDSGFGGATPATTGSATGATQDATQMDTAAAGTAESDLTTGGAAATTGTETAAAGGTGYEATTGEAPATTGTETAAAGGTGTEATTGEAPATTETETAAAGGTGTEATTGEAPATIETETAAAGTAESDLTTGGAFVGTDEVIVSRSFFGMSVEEILQRCQDDPTLSAIEVIGGAQSEAQ